MMNRILVPVFLLTALAGPGAHAATTGAETCGQAEISGAGWQVLARLDLTRPTRADAGSGAPGARNEVSGGGSEVETYIRFHLDAAAGDALSRLTPWPELGALAPEES